MTQIYNSMAQTALNQIDAKGRSITVTTTASAGTYDPATDTFTDGTTEDVSVKALFTQFRSQDIDGTLILQSDLRVLIAASALDAKPTTGDTITDDSAVYNVINTDVVQPGDTPILYMVQVRR